jgi:hypothetical protein
MNTTCFERICGDNLDTHKTLFALHQLTATDGYNTQGWDVCTLGTHRLPQHAVVFDCPVCFRLYHPGVLWAGPILIASWNPAPPRTAETRKQQASLSLQFHKVIISRQSLQQASSLQLLQIQIMQGWDNAFDCCLVQDKCIRTTRSLQWQKYCCSVWRNKIQNMSCHNSRTMKCLTWNFQSPFMKYLCSVTRREWNKVELGLGLLGNKVAKQLGTFLSWFFRRMRIKTSFLS